MANLNLQDRFHTPHIQWVPDIYTCLLALAQLIKDGFCVNLHEFGCTILDSDNRQLTSIREVGNIYSVDLAIVQSSTAMSTGLELTSEDLQEQLRGMPKAMVARPTYDVMRWHQRLGHLNVAAVRDLARNHSTGIDLDEDAAYDTDCMACIQGKQHKLPFKTGRTRANHLGDLIHMDLAGPMEMTSINGKKYFLIIIDDYS